MRRSTCFRILGDEDVLYEMGLHLASTTSALPQPLAPPAPVPAAYGVPAPPVTIGAAPAMTTPAAVLPVPPHPGAGHAGNGAGAGGQGPAAQTLPGGQGLGGHGAGSLGGLFGCGNARSAAAVCGGGGGGGGGFAGGYSAGATAGVPGGDNRGGWGAGPDGASVHATDMQESPQGAQLPTGADPPVSPRV